RKTLSRSRCFRRRNVVQHTRANEESTLRSRVDKTAILQGEIGLGHGGNADAVLKTGTPHARHAISGPHRSGIDVAGNRSGDFLVQRWSGRRHVLDYPHRTSFFQTVLVGYSLI